MVQVQAVLLDVGGPLDTEILWERRVDAAIRSAMASAGLPVSDADVAAAERYAVESFAPQAYKAMIWHLTGADPVLASRAYESFRALAGEGPTLELRDGMGELLGGLHARGVRLGLAANQPAKTLERLDALGLGPYFAHRGVSGTHGLRKPDPRVFLTACGALGVPPERCIMVGDRIDNDLAPARGLGMRAVRFLTGRHRHQRPRSWEEVPDAEVQDVQALEQTLGKMLDGS